MYAILIVELGPCQGLYAVFLSCMRPLERYAIVSTKRPSISHLGTLVEICLVPPVITALSLKQFVKLMFSRTALYWPAQPPGIYTDRRLTTCFGISSGSRNVRAARGQRECLSLGPLSDRQRNCSPYLLSMRNGATKGRSRWVYCTP
jgi:hypothetical protein